MLYSRCTWMRFLTKTSNKRCEKPQRWRGANDSAETFAISSSTSIRTMTKRTNWCCRSCSTYSATTLISFRRAFVPMAWEQNNYGKRCVRLVAAISWPKKALAWAHFTPVLRSPKFQPKPLVALVEGLVGRLGPLTLLTFFFFVFEPFCF